MLEIASLFMDTITLAQLNVMFQFSMYLICGVIFNILKISLPSLRPSCWSGSQISKHWDHKNFKVWQICFSTSWIHTVALSECVLRHLAWKLFSYFGFLSRNMSFTLATQNKIEIFLYILLLSQYMLEYTSQIHL